MMNTQNSISKKPFPVDIMFNGLEIDGKVITQPIIITRKPKTHKRKKYWNPAALDLELGLRLLKQNKRPKPEPVITFEMPRHGYDNDKRMMDFFRSWIDEIHAEHGDKLDPFIAKSALNPDNWEFEGYPNGIMMGMDPGIPGGDRSAIRCSGYPGFSGSHNSPNVPIPDMVPQTNEMHWPLPTSESEDKDK